MPEPVTEMITYEQSGGVTLFGSNDPDVVVGRASKCATALARVVEEKQLYTLISSRKHVRVEGWTLLGTMLGVFPICVWTRRIEGGWEARVEARTRDGAVVGAAESQCRDDERNWRDRDDFAIRSMAQTRATSKALRLPLGFIMAISGYEATPAEEMDAEAPEFTGGPRAQQRQPVTQPRRTDAAAPQPVGTAVPPQPAAQAQAKATAEAAPPSKKEKAQAAVEGADWSGKITKITARQQVGANGPYTLYKVFGEDGAEFSTFSDSFAEEARQCKEQGLDLIIQFSTNKYGKKIENCTRT